ncbi:hypothetical protein CEXT_108371 [Caerostris extrusa]|uniref:Uncharacterized protein n=1 Tax=Caerostris extrusa TaxID=172846 RepID=A0AAV4RC13_CAEEX|nr:hypothetical protein CEXT_108371 [Caerostris extrusa]
MSVLLKYKLSIQIELFSKTIFPFTSEENFGKKPKCKYAFSFPRNPKSLRWKASYAEEEKKEISVSHFYLHPFTQLPITTLRWSSGQPQVTTSYPYLRTLRSHVIQGSAFDVFGGGTIKPVLVHTIWGFKLDLSQKRLLTKA